MATGRTYPLAVVLSAVDRLTGPLRTVNTRLQQLTQPIRSVQNGLAGLSREAGVPRLAESFTRVKDAVGDVNTALHTTFRRMTVITAGAGGLAFLFKRQFIDTADTFERLEISLEAITGSAAKARDAMAFIKDLTVETPFEMEDIARSFRTLIGFGLDPMNGTLRAITDQVAKLGLTGQDLTGIALQLGQAFSKGRLMAQDSNILVERGVPVWAMLQRAIARVNNGQEISVAQLRKMSEEGQLGTKAIALLIEQMGIESQGASARMMKSWSGMMSNLSDQWTLFKKRVMDGGPFMVLKGHLQGILQTVDRMAADGRLQQWADRIGQAMLQAFEWLRREGPAIWSSVVTGLREIWGISSQIADAVGGWGNLIKVGLAAYIAGPMVVAVAKLGFALAGLNASLAGTPVGLMLIGGAALIGGGLAFANMRSAQIARDFEARNQPRRREILGTSAIAPGAPLGAEAARQPLRLSPEQAAALRSELAGKITVDFRNTPPGTRVDVDRGSTVPIDINTGYHFAEAR